MTAGIIALSLSTGGLEMVQHMTLWEQLLYMKDKVNRLYSIPL